jgi:tRNA (cytidine32/uridine32-2'-O)-methyltransferase
LLRPRNADNLGAIARAMKNFGLTEWVIVSPNPNLLEAPGTHRLAVKAGELLETVRRVESLEAAVADCNWVVGTTMRVIDGRRRLSPHEVATQARHREGTVALVFGDERSGLTNADLAQCHALSVIPTADAQPSLNLAQAVLVYAYTLFAGQADSAPRAPAPTAAPADDAQLRVMGAALSQSLERAGFLQNDGRTAVEQLMRVLQRAHSERSGAVDRGAQVAGEVASLSA